MKKILILFTLIFTMQSVQAVNVTVESLTPVNEKIDVENYAAKIIKDTKITDDITFKKDSVLNMEILKLVPAKWGKRNAYMVVKPIFIADNELFTPLDESNIEGKTTSIKVISKEDIKQNWKKDLKNAGFNAGMKVAANMVPGSGQVLQLSKGLLMPEEGQTRLQSAAGNFFDTLPTKHFKKGKPLDIKEGDTLVLKFYAVKE